MRSVPGYDNDPPESGLAVVCHPREALDCFLRTRMDVLVLGDYMIRRKTAVTDSVRAA